MKDDSDNSDNKDNHGKLKWDDLVFGAIEKIASAPSKLKDPKELGSQAFEWVKGVRDDIQERATKEFVERFRQLDWDSLAKKVSEHLAENYDVEVTARISLKPKSNRKKSHGPKPEKEADSKASDKSDESEA